jgi:hypothetical protein
MHGSIIVRIALVVAAAIAGEVAGANGECEVPIQCTTHTPDSLDAFCVTTFSPTAYCVSARFEGDDGCDVTVECHQTCESALVDDGGVCGEGGEDDILWAIVCGSVFLGIMLFYCFMKHCCTIVSDSTKLPTQTTTRRAHVIWIIWWTALIVVTQVCSLISTFFIAVGTQCILLYNMFNAMQISRFVFLLCHTMCRGDSDWPLSVHFLAGLDLSIPLLDLFLCHTICVKITTNKIYSDSVPPLKCV